MRFSTLVLATCLLFHSSTWAEEPKEEKAPPPRLIEAPPAVNLFLPPPALIHSSHGTRAVWNNYAVDRYGRWRPRVILAPFGSYYYYNGQPYPFQTLYPGSFRPVTHD